MSRPFSQMGLGFEGLFDLDKYFYRTFMSHRWWEYSGLMRVWELAWKLLFLSV